MATATAWRVHTALLLLGVILATFNHSALALCSPAESAALLKFKSVLLDPRGELATWGAAGANCCSWRGVKCSASGVEAIDLALDAPAGDNNNLVEIGPQASSTAGDALGALPHLSSLRTDYVSWNGPLPLRKLANAPIRELVIRNSPGGHLPSDIATLGGTLERLVVTGTNYKTGLPSSVCKLVKLKVLEVSSTGIPSLGPSCLGKITSLEEVRMQNNRGVTGGLPVWLTSLPNLKVLDLSNNAHSGDIPVQYGKLGAVDLHLGGNHLANHIPAGLSGKPVPTFRPGNEQLCGAPLAACPA